MMRVATTREVGCLTEARIARCRPDQRNSFRFAEYTSPEALVTERLVRFCAGPVVRDAPVSECTLGPGLECGDHRCGYADGLLT